MTYSEEIERLNPYCDIIELMSGTSRIAISPKFQGRVLTSCIDKDESGFGWLNHEFISSGQIQPHMQAYGGEDRFWIGPEAGPYALFFQSGEAFNQKNWQTPTCIDTEPFDLVGQNESNVSLSKTCQLVNYQGHRFDIEIARQVHILSEEEISVALGGFDLSGIQSVGFQSDNAIINRSDKAWSKKTGLLNIWILGQFHTGPNCWAIIPTLPGARINENYFEADLSERLVHKPGYSQLLLDGQQKAKIGLAPSHDRNVIGSYDRDTKTLTVVSYETDKNEAFLNSEWKIQPEPYNGDVLNVYNDGPDENELILGPYFELETSSSSRELPSGDSIHHRHSTYHFNGTFDALNKVSQQTLFTDLEGL